MLKILHTADWHLGVRLHKQDLTEDHRLFFQFLLQTIKERGVDVLLISGDIFDHANPSQEALQLYYEVLLQLKECGCQVILTGGNHDSPAILNMTRRFLKLMDIHVVGKAEPEIANQVIPLYNKNRDLKAVVCAAPFLRESDIRTSDAGEKETDKQQKRKEGMIQHFEALVKKAEVYGNVPILLMAHLFAAGAETKEQKRDITIGGLDAFSAADFPSACQYVALGHIHRPMAINGEKFIRYSGSPIALSFSEKEQIKELVEVIIHEDSSLAISTIPIPLQRKLIKFTGTFTDVKQQVETFKNPNPLKAFVELEVMEPDTDMDLALNIHQLVTRYDQEHLQILTYKYSRPGQTKSLTLRDDLSLDIENWSEMKVFEELLEKEKIVGDDREQLKIALEELLLKVTTENENQ
jgi:exonuclease SbcD